MKNGRRSGPATGPDIQGAARRCGEGVPLFQARIQARILRPNALLVPSTRRSRGPRGGRVPPPIISRYDNWAIAFKSIRIRREVVESMRLEEVGHLWKTYNLSRRITKGPIMARWVFEAVAHRMLSSGWQGPRPQLFCIVSDGGDPPVHYQVPAPLDCYASQLHPRARKRRILYPSQPRPIYDLPDASRIG